MRDRWASFEPGDVSDDYVGHLLFAMDLTWNHRFILRDRAQYAGGAGALRPDPDMAADLAELHELLRRIQQAKRFRRDLDVDLPILTRSLWIVSRYWMDHLRESEGLDVITEEHKARGIRHHFAVLLPYLTARARQQLEEAFVRATARP